jgi:hypothetical protein
VIEADPHKAEEGEQMLKLRLANLVLVFAIAALTCGLLHPASISGQELQQSKQKLRRQVNAISDR